MDINEIANKILFLEDLSDISGLGYADKPARVELYTEDRVNGQTVKTKILDESYYSDFDGKVRLDYSSIAQRLVYPTIATESKPFLFPSESEGYRDMLLVFKGYEYRFTANIFSAEAKDTISDIDYMAIPQNYIVLLNVYAWWAVHEVGLEFCEGTYRKISFRTGLNEEGKGFSTYYFNVAELGIKMNEPFRFIVKVYGPHGEAIYKTCVYEIIPGNYQQFLFAGRLGGYVSFAMSGHQEISSEWEIENARYDDRNGKVSTGSISVVKQYTGGLSVIAAAVLSELMNTEYAFHLVAGTWKPIIIDEPDITFQTSESLKYGSFSFRYTYDTPLRHIVQ